MKEVTKLREPVSAKFIFKYYIHRYLRYPRDSSKD